MFRIFLKLNTDKTEILIVGSKNQRQQIHLHLKSMSMKYSEQVRNFGIIFDSDLSLENHITNMRKQLFTLLKKHISKLWSLMSQT